MAPNLAPGGLTHALDGGPLLIGWFIVSVTPVIASARDARDLSPWIQRPDGALSDRAE